MNNINENLDHYYIYNEEQQQQQQEGESYSLDFDSFYPNPSSLESFEHPIALDSTTPIPFIGRHDLFTNSMIFNDQHQEQSSATSISNLPGTTTTVPYDFSSHDLLNDQDPNVLMSAIAESSSGPFYAQQPRKEQDVFSELINLAKASTVPERPSEHPSQYIVPSNQPLSSFRTVRHPLEKFYRPSPAEVATKEKFIYDLKIVQQPSRARMCGFGDKDRRAIVPAPILQLFISTKDGHDVNPEMFDVTFLVVLCDSCLQTGEPAAAASSTTTSKSASVPVSQVVVFSSSEEGRHPRTSRLKNLVGASVVSANKLYDLDGNLGIFFIFHDISLRTEGTFRLKFSLIDVGSPYSYNVNTETLSQVLQTVYSDPFTVYTAKKFPGVVQSTPLSICFARQGIKIPIRKESLGSKNKRKDNNDINQIQGAEEDYKDV
ncbi:hypothetical protein G6F70_004589 [Rhizopus microsporus]|uniref:Velvet domain-containing protein n=1 Tax=Rhizopus azygosporus TaxID=86630 RepID=A0A367JZT9_RHIAZ|nr:hypothetical protein G6F71_004671 [Rhizopus microsporus]RCH95399.1 hypothetical protein CU097_009387 [Rhizopus azygosporus]KAG1199816.1 hypothetical protein G6F70_004589 [Rhizopus microsporus]KAG1214009.1 hypothetical protein G6F69_002300 [Rhizopus microsporus]KAG1233440.1 hypothetical protein G6F67_004266 [Rhizopus microsporus]